MYSFGPFAHLNRTRLLPELQKHLVGNQLQHPLLHFENADPGLSARLNRLFEHRLRGKAKNVNAHDEWERLGPDLASFDRLNWYLRKIADEDSPCDYRIAGQIWTDPELPTNTCDVLAMLFKGPLPSFPIASFMVESELQRLEELPDEIQVIRGHIPILEQHSSWTLDPVVALDWACRRVAQGGIPNSELFTDTERQIWMPVVTIGTVKKSQTMAFVNRRGEDEILVNPLCVKDRTTFNVIHATGQQPAARQTTDDEIENDEPTPAHGT